MCGLAGVLTWNYAGHEDRRIVARMLDVMSHRGPDGRGICLAGSDLCMGAVRLAIVDPAESTQPIESSDGDIRLIFNGEIYNYRELRSDLMARGHRFRTSGDGEVILNMYREDPVGFAARLDGMFAFVLWDGIRRRLTMGRDRCGIKPLFYTTLRNGLTFASEAKGLLTHPDVPLGINAKAITAYLRWRFPVPPGSAFAGIQKVPAGCLVVAEPDGTRIEPFWSPPQPGDRPSNEPFGSVLQRAITTTSQGLAPVAMFLSGGLDSGAAVALAAEQSRNGGGRVETFSVGYGHGGWEDERAHAQAIAAHLQIGNTDTLLPDSSMPELFRDVMWHLEEPVYTPVTLSTYAVSALAAEYSKVAVSGDGSDELLMGYAHFAEAREIWQKGGPWRNHYSRALGWLDPEQYPGLVGAEVAGPPQHPDCPLYACEQQGGDGWSLAADPLDEMRRFEFTFKLPEYHLSRVDRLSMAHGLEVRVPFLRNDMVDWALGRFASDLLSTPTKQPLRDVVAGRLPGYLVTRPKQKFTAPVKLWLDGPLRSVARELLNDAEGADELGLGRGAVAELGRQLHDDPGRHTAAAWGVLVLLGWYAYVFQRLRAIRLARV
jgi:asparagine synthase (glutamine-hydrolysing)